MLKLPPVVILEEDSDDLFILRRRLEVCGVKNPVISFYDGDEAIAFFDDLARNVSPETMPCTFLTELKAFGSDGFAVIASVRKHAVFDAMKIFVITGSEDPSHIRRATEAGATGYYVKFPKIDEFCTLLSGSGCLLDGSPPVNQGPDPSCTR